jgi:hypothetical protein
MSEPTPPRCEAPIAVSVGPGIFFLRGFPRC